ncbi:MAG: 2-dehydro-3-deoxyphosphogluconate aldolase [Acidobacteriota bacterium]|nr:2-dehydro-3-deoxyphosphogluconate aldolase [Acidobacteriota bacterium]
MTREEITKHIHDAGLIPAIRVDSASLAIFAAEQVFAGGIPIVEIEDTVPDCTEVIRELHRLFPTLIVGAEVNSGLDELRVRLDAGADFITGIGFLPKVVAHCVEQRVTVIPGAMTPTEILAAHAAGADFVKVFPCGDVGGEKYIRALKAALPRVRLMASGGVTQSTAGQYILAGAEVLGVGEDLIPRQALRYKEGAWIRELASRFLKFVQEARAAA